MITKAEIAKARVQGKERGLAGAPLAENPHKITQGSPTRPLGMAWTLGHREGTEIRMRDNAHQANLDDVTGDWAR